jgi:hypothetical protein
MSHYLEEIWDDILSRRPARIRRRFDLLDAASRQEVMEHLTRMTTEDGWQEAQVISAQAALAALAENSRSDHGRE